MPLKELFALRTPARKRWYRAEACTSGNCLKLPPLMAGGSRSYREAFYVLGNYVAFFSPANIARNTPPAHRPALPTSSPVSSARAGHARCLKCIPGFSSRHWHAVYRQSSTTSCSSAKSSDDFNLYTGIRQNILHFPDFVGVAGGQNHDLGLLHTVLWC